MVALSSPMRSRQSYDRLKTNIQAKASGVPARYWICGAVGTVLCLALLAVGAQEQHTEQIWAKAGEVSTVLKAKTFGIPIPKEALSDADYFVQNAIAPASWSRTYNPPSCVHDYVTRKGILKSPRPLDEWRRSFATESGCPSYPIPKGGFLFHVHWEGPWLEELELTIDSFLATQRLQAGHRIIFWHAREIPPPPEVLEHYEDLAPSSIEFRILDRLEESEGTCLMDMPDWTDEETRKEKNMKPASLSNLTRLLLLSKYGGVWVDSDVVFVRDVTDLLRVGPLAPAYYPEAGQKGTKSPHFYNNHLYVVGPEPSPVAEKMLQTACGLSYGPDNWPAEHSFKPMAGRVFNDGLLQLCERVTHCGLSAFPLSLVESETWTPEPILKPCLSQTTDAQVDQVLQRVWMWHFRHDCQRYGSDDTTAYAIVKRRVAAALPYNLDHGLGQILAGAE